jgi:hypothetical protein
MVTLVDSSSSIQILQNSNEGIAVEFGKGKKAALPIWGN